MIYKKLNNGEIHTWFPKSIFLKDNLHIDSLNDYRLGLISLSKDIEKKEYQNVKNSHNIFTIHNQKQFKKLFKSIFDSVKNFMFELGYTDDILKDLKFQNSWFNVGQKGDFLHRHKHGGSIISGAFYVSCDKDDEITFVNDENGIFPPKNYNDLSYQYCKYQCIPGRLILFSSDLGHCTNPQKSNEKITISFNIGV